MNTNEMDFLVKEVLDSTPFIDIHTHLFAPSFGSLALWGIDDLLTYHYLEAELFRYSHTRPEDYWALNKQQRADVIWKTLFVENTPVSEAARGVIAVLKAFGLDSNALSRLQRTKDGLQIFSRSCPIRSRSQLSVLSLACGLAGAVSGLRTSPVVDNWLDFSNSAYGPIFLVAGTAYLAAFVLIHAFVPHLGDRG